MPRKAGSYCRFKCRVCGTVERTRGGSHMFRCSDCRDKGKGLGEHAIWASLGKDWAGSETKAAVRDGRLPHPSTMVCVDCDGPAIEYEHRDYNKPLEVEPVCRRCNLLRGPAVPRRGGVERLLDAGLVPYSLRASFEKLCTTMGRPEVAEGIQSAKMTIDDWRERWPRLMLPDPTWPHPGGRPTIDVAAPVKGA